MIYVITGYRGRTFVDCRVFWKNDKDEWQPSKKGISLSAGVVDEVIAGLQKASEELERRLSPKERKGKVA